jgi:hypothetical protein
MKPFISFYAIFVLFQSLMLGSLVKLELPAVYQVKWEETRFNSQEPLDIFIRPEQGNKLRNLQNRNHRFPYHFNTAINSKHIAISPSLSEIPFKSIDRRYYLSIPVYIFNGVFRL